MLEPSTPRYHTGPVRLDTGLDPTPVLSGITRGPCPSSTTTLGIAGRSINRNSVGTTPGGSRETLAPHGAGGRLLVRLFHARQGFPPASSARSTSSVDHRTRRHDGPGDRLLRPNLADDQRVRIRPELEPTPMTDATRPFASPCRSRPRSTSYLPSSRSCATSSYVLPGGLAPSEHCTTGYLDLWSPGR